MCSALHGLTLGVLGAGLVGCAGTSPSAARRAASTAAAPVATCDGGDGLSCGTRVVVHATNERAGVDAETDWLLRRYPGHQRGMQSLSKCGERPVDVVRIHTAEGATLDVYFDIFEFYGHF